tara:strand:+ start:15718 stop:16425 length:708 start_codon:yes stop_codon:yes gene_type:complete
MFGKYKNSITNTLVESYSKKEKFKKSFNSVMAPLKENKISREFFVLYGEIENKKFEDKNLAEAYLDEVIKTLRNKKSKLRIPQINNKLKENKIYSKLDSLIFNESVKAIENNINNKRDLLEHLTKKEKYTKPVKPVVTSILSNILTRKFNEKYSSLSEEDTIKLKTLLSLDKDKLENKILELQESTLERLNTLKEDTKDSIMKDKIQEVCESIVNSDMSASSILKIENLNKSLIK